MLTTLGQFRFGLRVLGLMEFSETRMTYYDQWTDDTPGVYLSSFIL